MNCVAEMGILYRKKNKKWIIKYDKNNYVIFEGVGKFSITPNKRYATVFDSLQEAEKCLRELWIDGEVAIA